MTAPATTDPLRLGPGAPRLIDQLPELADVAARRWSQMMVPAHSAVEDAPDRFRINMKNASRSLLDAGATSEEVDVLIEELEGLGHDAGPAVIALVADGHLVLSGTLPVEPEGVHVAIGPVPALVPALDLERHDIAHLAVLVDREGADIVVAPRSGGTTEAHFTGDTDVINQVKAGGWSQRRFQQRARNTWDENAEGVAEHVVENAELIEAELIIVSGDPKATPRLIDRLPSRWQTKVLVDDGPSRHDADELIDLTDTMVADHVARRATALLGELREALARDEALEGPELVDLLGEGRIGRVVVSRRVDPESATGYLTESGVLIGTPDRLAGSGEDGVEASLVDLAVWGAAKFGASVEIIPGGGAAPAGGVAGFRRGR